MGPIDHSLTYRRRCWRNIPHRYRLKKLINILTQLSQQDVSQWCFADFGCSNGYLTNLLSEKFHFRQSFGFDHNVDNLSIATHDYPNIKFEVFDLNASDAARDRYDMVSCFETLEHVGNPNNAVLNLLNSTKPGGTLLISVPIEIGFWGVIKLLARTLLRQSSFKELRAVHRFRYGLALIVGRRISAFRDNRKGWGTHLGFDYRDIDDILKSHRAEYQAFNTFTTRLYIVTG